MLDVLRDRIASFLAQHNVGIISVASPGAVHSVVTRYVSDGLGVVCSLPRWSEVAYYVRTYPRVSFVVPDTITKPEILLWFQAEGLAHIVPPPRHITLPGLPSDISELEELFTFVRIVFYRLDLWDEAQGWGARDTLEM